MQGDGAGALEVLAIPQNQAYVTVRNLKALALIQLDRLDDLLPLLRSVVEQDSAFQTRQYPGFFSDVVCSILTPNVKKVDTIISAVFPNKVGGTTERG